MCVVCIHINADLTISIAYLAQIHQFIKDISILALIYTTILSESYMIESIVNSAQNQSCSTDQAKNWVLKVRKTLGKTYLLYNYIYLISINKVSRILFSKNLYTKTISDNKDNNLTL